jgi:hypothetical protein
MSVPSICCVFVPLLGCLCAAQTPVSPAPAPTAHTCPVGKAPAASEADKAFQARDFTKAEQLFHAAAAAAADEDTFAHASASLVQTLIAQGKSREALIAATDALKLHNHNPLLLDAYGEAEFRRGNMSEAALALYAARKLDFCNARVHYDTATYLRLDAEDASGQKELEIAHQLEPDKAAITNAMLSDTLSQASLERQAALGDQLLDNPSLSADRRVALQKSNGALRAAARGGWEIIIKPVTATTFPIVPISSGPNPMYAAGLEVLINGKKRRLELDTGASGLTITRSAAKAAGLEPEMHTSIRGIGDEGGTGVSIAHADDVKIGDLEFRNCMVAITDKTLTADAEGLIGPDIFSSYVVTLDLPGREIRLSPLPSVLDEKDLGDRYIAPEMTSWNKVFRSGHMLLFPAQINNGPPRLILMDTGSPGEGLISVAAARDITDVSGSNRLVKGASGMVRDVGTADTVDITFGGIREKLHNVTAIDMGKVGIADGAEISGIVGFYTLRELVISIDYRESLVQLIYDPKHGFHRKLTQ